MLTYHFISLQVQMEEERASSSQIGKRKGRGASKGIKSSGEPMILEYNDLYQPVGRWEKEYGQHIGHCASLIDINCREWKNVDKDLQQSMWDDTKVKTYICRIFVEFFFSISIYR